MTILTETIWNGKHRVSLSSVLVEMRPVNLLGCNPIRWELLVGYACGLGLVDVVTQCCNVK